MRSFNYRYLWNKICIKLFLSFSQHIVQDKCVNIYYENYIFRLNRNCHKEKEIKIPRALPENVLIH